MTDTIFRNIKLEADTATWPISHTSYFMQHLFQNRNDLSDKLS